MHHLSSPYAWYMESISLFIYETKPRDTVLLSVPLDYDSSNTNNRPQVTISVAIFFNCRMSHCSVMIVSMLGLVSGLIGHVKLRTNFLLRHGWDRFH